MNIERNMRLLRIRRHIRIKARKLKKIVDKLFSRSYFRAIFILNVIALLNFYSVGGVKAVLSQAIIFVCGTMMAIGLSHINYEWLKRIAIPVYVFVCSLLVLTATIGTRINGARRWLKLFGFTLQPTELFKIALILIVGFYLEERTKPNTRNGRQYNLIDLIIPLTFMFLPLILILKQPDLGTAVICLFITGATLFFIGIEKRTLALIIIVLCSIGFVGWKHLQLYQKDRIVNFLNPAVDSRGKNWQSHQSLISFGSGGLIGKGIKNGPETQLGFLPEKNTDFALAALAEEHGFIIIGIVLLFVHFIVIKLLFIAENARDKFSAVVSIGVAFWLSCQSIMNAGMVIGLLPVVGVPFPIISYGGSSLFVILLAMGIIANIEQRRNVLHT